MNTRTLITALILIALALAACSGSGNDTEPSRDASLEGTQWVLQTLNGQLSLAGTTPTAEFSESQVSGSSGCNHYSGSYEATGDKLAVSDLMATEMYCTEPAGAMDQEHAFLSALRLVTNYRLVADQLEMLDAEGKALLVFAPPAPMPEETLKDTEWTLATFVEAEAATSLIRDTAITLLFEHGQVKGSAGCNDYSGPYTLERGTFKIIEIAITERGCVEPAGIMEQEARYIDILRSATIFEIDANQLTLHTTDGRGLMYTATLEDVTHPLSAIQPSYLATPVSQEPAAGICADFEGDWVVVTIQPGIPDPRCARITPSQKLRVVNRTPGTLHVLLGNLEATIEPDAEHAFDVPFGEYLAPGVHVLQASSCCGPELWLKAGSR